MRLRNAIIHINPLAINVQNCHFAVALLSWISWRLQGSVPRVCSVLFGLAMRVQCATMRLSWCRPQTLRRGKLPRNGWRMLCEVGRASGRLGAWQIGEIPRLEWQVCKIERECTGGRLQPVEQIGGNLI